jgi:hypothetical protein
MIYRALFVETPPCFLRLILIIGALILIIPALIWGIGILRAMNMAQLPMSDVELHAHTEDVWLNSQLHLLEVDGKLCTPPQSMFLPVVHATLNNQLIEMTLETPYGGVDSSAFSPYSACLTSPLPTNDLSLVRVVMYEVYNPFDMTIYEWAVKEGLPSFPLIVNPVGKGGIETRAYNLWLNPQAEDDLFERPWIKDIIDDHSVTVCLAIHVEGSPWLEMRLNGRMLELVDRYQSLVTRDDGQSIIQDTACFRMLVYPDRRLLQAVVQDSPTGYQIHQWGIEVVYDDYFYKHKACLAVSQAASKCFLETQK